MSEHIADPVRGFHNCPRCGRRVIWEGTSGYDMLCDATIIVVDDKQEEWGTSSPHHCPRHTQRRESEPNHQSPISSQA